MQVTGVTIAPTPGVKRNAPPAQPAPAIPAPVQDAPQSRQDAPVAAPAPIPVAEPAPVAPPQLRPEIPQ